jgi:two-component system response regulator YesN
MPNTILLVDDDSDFREEFKDYFNNYTIVEARDGEGALSLLKKPNEIDLVILDVRMPGIQGTEVLTEIKKMAPDLGVIILTGNSCEDVAIDAVKGHADDYLQKPVDLNAVRESIEKLLELKAARFPGYSDDKIEKAKRYLERNCYKMVSLDDVSLAVALSPKYLSRLFMKNTGMGFNEYKLSLRLKEAKNLLKTTSLNVEQISDKLGYQNIESLTRLFKKHTGLTPLAYRKKFKGKNQTNRKKIKFPAKKQKGK